MRNVHTRLLAAPIERVRPFIEASWSGTERDPFPRDVLRTWRKNPAGVEPLALVPDVTRVGHGMFAFRFLSWDGHRWRVKVETRDFRGWHGFDLEETPRGCQVTHTIELELSSKARLVWPLLIASIHDWCVEALFDRIEAALVTGEIPALTRRPMPWPAAASLGLLRKVASLRKSRQRSARVEASGGASLSLGRPGTALCASPPSGRGRAPERRLR
jgi:hypothetical protein